MSDTEKRCGQCGEEFATYGALRVHADSEHVLRVVSEDPLVLHVNCGSSELPESSAAHRLANGVAELRRHYPRRRFQFVPIAGVWKGEVRDFRKRGMPIVDARLRGDDPITSAAVTLTSWLAIAEPEG